ncbi:MULTISPECIES: MocR-like transcription factor YczR [Pseudonocardia]|uniref:GntR family transcriptional regulator n=2 Tax=Pseudonocardia TaxID=1847 RepID=A0ABQ0SA30_9PSEU|nr:MULTISPECIES: PLP-dependent aminotransferase family protein [Pseudonocardia]OSY42560.1 putative HTH-type transcriptional regulator YdcR [Pseudonocardia autotrophica]TDN76079.1 GntR family transcriptional regulator [Pseudonocardia autotrophica]BBG00057.1 GntR family transcriptional regulator [Pseudonocardia autotrophica]GEC29770.1 GntR family transcriptional regulator [Pseudonocardia saturnea]
MDGIGAAALAGLCGDVRRGRGPVYRTLADAIRVLVGDGRLPAGTRLPAERSLAERLRVSRITVTHAYRELREDGWVDARQGSGTWVRLPDGPARVDGAWVPGPARGGVIDLAHAAPVAPPGMSELVRRAARRLDGELAGHGYGPDGHPDLRERIAARFTARGVPTDPDRIVVTGGALQAIGIAVAELTGAGDRVLVEHPTYPAVLDVLSDAGVRPVPVALGPGIEDALPRASRQTAARAAYLMADFQNPTGRLLDDDVRARLLHRLARQGTVAIVDETFAELDLREGATAPLPCAAHALREDDVVTVGGASKIAWGGLRLGWIRAAREPAARMRRRLARAQIAQPVLEQLIAVEVLDALDEIRGRRTAELRLRRDRLVGELAVVLPEWRPVVPDGGLVLWCDLGADLSTALTAVAPRHGLTLAPGPRFGTGYAFEDRLRLPFVHPEPVLTEAVRRLRRVLDDVVGTPVDAGRTGEPARLVV